MTKVKLPGITRTKCTCYVDAPRRCGRVDDCTYVRLVDGSGITRHEHWVCEPCRRLMELPDKSVIVGPDGLHLDVEEVTHG